MVRPIATSKTSLEETKDGDLREKTSFPIQSNDGQEYLFDRFYVETFDYVLEAVTFDGICELMICANKGSPTFILSSSVRKGEASKIVYPLPRIIWDAKAGQQINRISMRGPMQLEWTCSNTERKGGKQGNNDTRNEFLKLIEGLISNKEGPEGARLVRLELENKLALADAMHRPGVKTTEIEMTHSID